MSSNKIFFFINSTIGFTVDMGKKNLDRLLFQIGAYPLLQDGCAHYTTRLVIRQIMLARGEKQMACFCCVTCFGIAKVCTACDFGIYFDFMRMWFDSFYCGLW